MSYPNFVFSIFAFIGFVLAIILLPWRLDAWNSGTCLFMVWTAVSCLNQFVNSVVWNGNVKNWAPVWCDISQRIIIGASVAILACSLCINRRLYHISCLKSLNTTKEEKRRTVIVDLAIGLGIPVLEMIISYITQGHRFDILEDIGCTPAIFSTPVAFVLVSAPPMVLGCITAPYCVLTIRALYRKQEELKALMQDSGRIDLDRYTRLMCISATGLVFTLPLCAYVIYENSCRIPIHPWISWGDTHFDFSRIEQIPANYWRSNSEAVLEFGRWQVVVISFIFFALFGFSQKAKQNYRLIAQFIITRVGRLKKHSSTLQNQPPNVDAWRRGYGK